MENGSINILNFIIYFQFQVMPQYDFDDYVIAYNLSMLLTYKVTFYYIILHKSELQISKQC